MIDAGIVLFNECLAKHDAFCCDLSDMGIEYGGSQSVGDDYFCETITVSSDLFPSIVHIVDKYGFDTEEYSGTVHIKTVLLSREGDIYFLSEE